MTSSQNQPTPHNKNSGMKSISRYSQHNGEKKSAANLNRTGVTQSFALQAAVASQ
jgi:hypothetical protein